MTQDGNGTADSDGTGHAPPTRKIGRRGVLTTTAAGAVATSGCLGGLLGGLPGSNGGGGSGGTRVPPPDITVETTIEVDADETLNAALDGVDGAVRVELPEGVTEYAEPITRTATTVVRGQGKGASTLRPSADVKLVQQTDTIHEWAEGQDTVGRPDRRPLTNAGRDQPGLYDGSLAFVDLTIDRDNRPAPRVRNDANGQPGPNFMLATPTDTLAFHNVRMEKFDFADRTGVMMHAAGRLADISLRNVTIDFQAGGGVTNRPTRDGRGGRVAVSLFDADADRYLIDEHSLIQGNTLARPPRVKPENWGSILGVGGLVFEQGDIDATFREWDYAAWNGVGPAAKGASLTFRGDNLDAGFADQYWPRPAKNGGHLRWEGVTLTSAKNNVYHDYGFKVNTGGRFAERLASVTVTDCSVSGRGNPFQTIGGGIDEVRVENFEVASRNKGVRIGGGHIGRLDIDGLTIRPHESLEYFTTPIELRKGDWGPEHRIANVDATGYLRGPIVDQTGEDATIQTENIQAEPYEFTLDEGMDLGLLPRTESVDGTKSPNYYSILWRRHPGTFRIGDDFSVVGDGEQKSRDGATVMVSWDAEKLYANFTLPGQGNVPPTTTDMTDGQIVRIGVAPDASDPDSWVEVDAARAEDGDRAYLREYPGGDGRTAGDVQVGSSIDEEYGNMFFEVGIPWSVSGVDPNASSIRVDVGIRNANNDGRPIGRLQLFDSNGIWSSHEPTDYKRAQLLGDRYGPGDPRAGLHG